MTAGTAVRGGATRRVRHHVGYCDEHSRFTAGCKACQDRNNGARRLRTRLKAYGQWDRGIVDTAAAREHIRELNDEHHMSLRQIADAAGVSHSAVEDIASGAQTRAAQFTVDAISGVKPQPPANPLRRVPAHGTARRLQAFTAAGFDTPHLCDLLDARPADIQRWRRLDSPWVSAATHRKVKALADRIGRRSGPSEAARRKGARYRWALLAEWDDIDRPDAQPAPLGGDDTTVDEAVIDLAVRGRVWFSRLTTPEKTLTYQRWCDTRSRAGQSTGAKPFARAFGITEWQARQTARAATTTPSPIPAADSRTNRKVA